MRKAEIDDLLTAPHLKDVGFFKDEEHPSEGKIRRTRLANTFSGGARENQTHAPTFGEHTKEILAEAGYAPTEIDAICGAVVETGQKHGIDTPVNWACWKLVKALTGA